MTPARTTRLAPLLAVAGCLIGLLLAGYVGGYFWLGERRSTNSYREIIRDFPVEWLRTVYCPAGIVEARVTGRVVYLSFPVPVLFGNAVPAYCVDRYEP